MVPHGNAKKQVARDNQTKGQINMVFRALSLALALTLASAACAPMPQPDLTAAPAGDYALDPSHASVVFRVDHANGLSRFVGRFDTFDAALTFDPTAPEAARIEATIDAASINTGLGDFDDQLANHNAILDAKDHPQIRFASTNITLTGENTALVTGDLTLRGQTRPLTLDVVFNGSARDVLRGNRQVLGFSATARVNRSEWGADAYVNFGVGDEVEMLIEAEFLRQ